MGLDEWVDQALAPLADALTAAVFFSFEVGGAAVPLIVLWLVAAGVFFTLYLRGINIRGFGEAVRIVAGKSGAGAERGEISAYAALSTAISGTVGIGNIGGVAIALSLGGPGATFWMVMAGLLGMATKCAECTLGVKYRSHHEDGSVSGGPMYTLLRGFAARGQAGLGRALGGFYALSMVIGCLGIGNMFQANQAYQQFVVVTGEMPASSRRTPGSSESCWPAPSVSSSWEGFEASRASQSGSYR